MSFAFGGTGPNRATVSPWTLFPAAGLGRVGLAHRIRFSSVCHPLKELSGLRLRVEGGKGLCIFG